MREKRSLGNHLQEPWGTYKRKTVIVAVYACGIDVEKGPIRPQLWNAPPCDNVESWFGAQSRMIPESSVRESLDEDQVLLLRKLNEEADMGLLMSVTPNRSQVVRFSVVLIQEGIGVLYRLPLVSDSSQSLVTPFRPKAWTAILCLASAMGPALCLLARTNRRWVHRRAPVLSLGDCIWFIYSGLVKQGSELSPVGGGPCLLFATWWLGALVIGALYTANLTAVLALPRPRMAHSTAELSGLRWVTRQGLALENDIKNPGESGELQPLYRSWLNRHGIFVETNEAALRMVLRGSHVLMDESVTLDTLIYEDFLRSNRTCRFTRIPFMFAHQPIAMAYRLDFPYVQHFDRYLKKLLWSGMVAKWHAYHVPGLSICRQVHMRRTEGQRSMGLEDLYGAFLAFLVGVGTGLAGLAVEWVMTLLRA
ncbi:hypothetical protein LAZ67_4001997 [Cordylochernes scorpioides]|uniref:Ionotropic glutamate receptor C-terminal domain-containing protein n=1 Tax=Cordylochernes scorpioides TaxID=51811 RepID=A0ABY6KCG6_9ARAC|nr:hypothetical protein LAZ67_4001997 [Cordylochernes scorpioides]